MRVEQVMTRRVVTVSMDDTVATVREIFETYGFHHLIVEENGQVVGVISDRDLLRNLSPFVGKMNERPQDLFLERRRVHQIMTRKLIAVSPDTSLLEAAIKMLDDRVSCLPVVDARMRCVGILTMRDLLTWSLRCMQDEQNAEDEGESGASCAA